MLAVCGGKGGCGKTTTTFGLARELRRGGTAVTAVDCDRDLPDLHALAGVPRSPTLADVGGTGTPGDVAADHHTPPGDPPGHEVPGLSGLRIVPAAPATDDARVGPALERVRAAEGVALLDCPAGAGPDAVAPLRHADASLLVTEVTPQSLADAAKTAAMARAVDAPPCGVVLTRSETDPGVESVVDAPVLARLPDAARPLAVSSVANRLAECVNDLQRRRII